MFPFDQPPRLDQRNGVLRSYSISYREYDPAGKQFKKWQHMSVPATREQESVILSNLKPSSEYGIIIQARTNAGIGPASTAPFCSTLDEGKMENMRGYQNTTRNMNVILITMPV